MIVNTTIKGEGKFIQTYFSMLISKVPNYKLIDLFRYNITVTI